MHLHVQRAGRRKSAGTTSLEALVAFGLLSTVLALSTPLVVQHRRLLTAQRDYRLALDELSNQLERLTALPGSDLAPALDKLKPSGFAAAKLPGAELRGELAAADVGQRLTLRLSWDEPGRKAAPVVMAAWVFPKPANASSPTTSARSQQP